MTDILVANEEGKLLYFQVPDDEALPDELTVPMHFPVQVEGKFAGWEPYGTPRRWLRSDMHYSIYVPGEGLRKLVLHLYKPAPPRGDPDISSRRAVEQEGYIL